LVWELSVRSLGFADFLMCGKQFPSHDFTGVVTREGISISI
jgi:hypothetical protein